MTRRRWLIAAAVVLVLAAAGATAVTLRVLDHRYGPISAGEFSGPARAADFAVGDDSLRLRPGVAGHALTALADDGAHSVRVLSIRGSGVVDGRDEPVGAAVAEVQWSSYRFHDGGAISGENTPWHRLPAVVPADGLVRLLVVVRRPSRCTGAAAVYNGALIVRWRSLVAVHTTVIDTGLKIRVC